MAYCNISDAFNINNKFDSTMKGIRSFNPASFELSSVSNGYGSLTNIENEYESPYGQSFNDCGKSLNGTDLSNLINNQTQLNYGISDDAKLNLNFQTYILSGS